MGAIVVAIKNKINYVTFFFNLKETVNIALAYVIRHK